MKTFLIVDDIKSWRDFHKYVINSLWGNNVNILTAENAKEAYNVLLQKKPIDGIITDLQMEDDFAPIQAGEWFIEQIKTFNCYYNTPIILISASNSARIIAKRLGVYCIPKSTAQTCLSAYREIFNKIK